MDKINERREYIENAYSRIPNEMTVVGYVHAQFLKVTLLILYANKWKSRVTA